MAIETDDKFIKVGQLENVVKPYIDNNYIAKNKIGNGLSIDNKTGILSADFDNKLENVSTDTADIKSAASSTDYLALIDSNDNGKMKKVLVSQIGGTTFITINPPQVKGTYTYDGTEQTVQWEDYYNFETVVLGGTLSATDAGTYNATVAPKTGYAWSDGSTGVKLVSWTIGRATIQDEPIQSGVLTYTGESQTPTWSNYNTSQLTLSGVVSGTNADTYTAIFTPTDNYKWSDDTITSKNITWAIDKADDVITLSKSSVELKADDSDTVTITHLGTGTVSAVSSNTNVATVSLNGSVLTISAGDTEGDATITISADSDSNYNAPDEQTISVQLQFLVIKSFSECTEQEATDMIAAHYANQIDISDYWSVGDTRTIAFAGTSTTSEISTAHAACDMQIRIIGINHDTLATPINGHTKAAITCEFVNSLAEKCYIWGVTRNGSASPTGGLQDSDVWSNNPRRTWLNSTFKSALPSTLSGAIKTVVKTTKSSHTGSTTETTNDDVFLLSVYEVYKDTDTNYGNTTNKIAEGSQYKFYETSSNRIATDYYVGTSNRAYHWLRSPASYYNGSIGYAWCSVDSESGAYYGNGSNTYGLAPAFAI